MMQFISTIVHAVFLRDLAHELHHRRRADADAVVILLTRLGLLQQLLELDGGEAFSP